MAWQAASVTFQTQKSNAGYVRQDTDRRLDNFNSLTQFTQSIQWYCTRLLLFGMHLVCCRCFSVKPQPSNNDRYGAIWDAAAANEY